MAKVTKSRHVRRVFVRTPGGRTKLTYRRKLKSKKKCAGCGKPLHGIPRDTRRLPKSKKRVNRPYGGYFRSSCMREILKEKIMESIEK